VVPLRDGDDVLVHASYQAGFGVVDFNDLGTTVEVGWSDPPPIPTPPGSPFCAPVGCEIGGDWSTYWYNNFIYESSITEGFNVFRFSGPQTAGAMRLGHLNPEHAGVHDRVAGGTPNAEGPGMGRQARASTVIMRL